MYFNNSSTYSSHHNFLEDYNPNREIDKDPNRLLPKGLFNDMMDQGIESNQSSIQFDNVSGFTNAQFYNALTNNVNSMLDYKALILQQNNFNQQNEVTQLFNEYGY